MIDSLKEQHKDRATAETTSIDRIMKLLNIHIDTRPKTPCRSQKKETPETSISSAKLGQIQTNCFSIPTSSTPLLCSPAASSRCTNRKPCLSRSSLIHAQAARSSLPILSSWILNLSKVSVGSSQVCWNWQTMWNGLN